jgi:hypothetical protein
MGKAIRVEISPGELIDKLTILEIKRERIRDPQKLTHVNAEYEELRRAWDVEAPEAPAVHALWARLREVNERLWVTEDEIRECERRRDFGERFVELARDVYKTNDVRSELKREINVGLGSALVEEKSYKPY